MGIMPNSVWLAEPLPLLLYLLLLPSPIDAFYAVKYSSPTSATCPIAGQPYVVQALFQADNRTVTGARWLNPTNGVLTQSAIAARANITFWKTGDTWTSWLTLTPFVATDSTPYVFMLLSNSTNLTVGFTFTTNFTVPAAATFRVNVTGVNLVRCIPSCDRPGMTYTWRLNNATVVGAVAQNLTIAASGNYTCAYANSTVSNATFVQFTPPTTTQTTNTPTTITNTTTPTTIPTTPTTPTTQTAIPTTPTTPTTPTAIPTTPTPTTPTTIPTTPTTPTTPTAIPTTPTPTTPTTIPTTPTTPNTTTPTTIPTTPTAIPTTPTTPSTIPPTTPTPTTIPTTTSTTSPRAFRNVALSVETAAPATVGAIGIVVDAPAASSPAAADTPRPIIVLKPISITSAVDTTDTTDVVGATTFETPTVPTEVNGSVLNPTAVALIAMGVGELVVVTAIVIIFLALCTTTI
ncbi:truncated membrane protein ORF27 [Cyprinid herpesvirus 3]|uniref:ORF27 n=1 Tax=Cyprinid herpesvirus 3 TaxID=180230 RepID=A4FTD5_CYHV3|nr:ORF27 [Cyprinid herpesvirus 3]AOO33219.1 truncated membrane protein ORF27 [Cyprinid herpesvirus 3]AVL27767.1 membrane protein ORF27 [Cyprinid herpesvirus 3]AVL28122.1 membrane protein ORF27 [Cyprinid herpesvirus 3]AVL28282.1 membrane protein ORF27 [Cyprinid herpesvirus 3]